MTIIVESYIGQHQPRELTVLHVILVWEILESARIE